MNLIITSTEDLRRIVDASVEAATEKVLSRVKTTESSHKEWLTNREVMGFLGLSKATLQRYRTSGRLPYSKIGGNIYYRYHDLVAVLEDNLVREEGMQ